MTGLKPYGRAALVDMCGHGDEAVGDALPWHDLKDDGLWLTDRSFGLSGAELATMRWHPHKSSTVPALPVPFAATDLAAFFLAGGGLFLYERFDYNALDADVLSVQGHDAGRLVALSEGYQEELREAADVAFRQFEDALRHLGDNADEAREVLNEAVTLRRLADAKFGRDDEAVRKSARWLLHDAQQELAADIRSTHRAIEPDHSLLATRAQLTEAFGAFTGMDRTWFDNLTDAPALLHARRVKGRGQRGNRREPLFCPMEVMTWLMDPKRRKGRKFHSESKPWELLAKHFPKVHAVHSSADPRQD